MAGLAQRQQQTLSMSPEHIMGKAVLKMSLQELQQFVQAQITENPAISMEEESLCPTCGCVLINDACPACGSEKAEPQTVESEEWDDGTWTLSGQVDDESFEPFARVAAPKSLSDHLREQIQFSVSDHDRKIADHLIDSLDEDGFLTEPLIDISRRYCLSVPQAEVVLSIIQSLDPPGVGARDLQECLLIQLAQIEDESGIKSLAELIIRKCWDALPKMKYERIADALGVRPQSVVEAVNFIREHLTPHPAASFRDPWEKLAPRTICQTSPDIIIRRTESGLMADVDDGFHSQIGIEDAYAALYARMCEGRNGFSAPDRTHVKDCMTKAKALVEALEFRKSTLRRIADALLRRQAGFFVDGPSALLPMTKKELASELGVHESTVCRATQDKSIRLPTGEVIPVDMLFDSALPVKELIRKLSTQRMSDGEIADELAKQGIHIARRTVAKYRSQLRVLSVEYRAAA